MLAPLVFAALVAQASPAASPSPAAAAAPAATPTPDPTVVARAKAWFKMLQTGKPDRTQMTPEWNKFSDAQFAKVAAQIGPLGDPVTFEQEKIVVQDGSTAYVYLLAFGDGTKLAYVFSVDNTSGKISGLWIRQPQ